MPSDKASKRLSYYQEIRPVIIKNFKVEPLPDRHDIRDSSHPSVGKLQQRGCPTDNRSLFETISELNPVKIHSFEALQKALESQRSFFDKTLPFMYQLAVHAHQILPKDLMILDQPGRVSFTQQQCACILSCAFFCAFHNRPSFDCISSHNFPSINFDRLYGQTGNLTMLSAKIKMLLSYFSSCQRRSEESQTLQRKVHFFRRHKPKFTQEALSSLGTALIAPVLHPLGESLENARNMIKVDFANQNIGGAALAYGCVQEEIMFCVVPELIVSRLLCTMMRDEEAILIIGAEQFTKAKGYGYGLEFGGDYEDDTSLLPDGTLASYIVAMDALDLSEDSQVQYQPEYIIREFGKALAGFDVPVGPSEVATGNWGCGMFGGDVELKSVIQWMAASQAQKVMHYYPWDSYVVDGMFPEVIEKLMDGPVIGDVAQVLFEHFEQSPGESVYESLLESF